MPELPDVEVIKEFLLSHAIGQTVVSVEHVGPIVIRHMLPGDPQSALSGRTINAAHRAGKFLVLGLEGSVYVVINFMLSGRLAYCAPSARIGPRTFLVLQLSGGEQLRYTDAAQMGKVYITDDTARVPLFAEQGPDALDPALTLDVFRNRLRRFPGEIKSALVNQSFVAGIGNAYADEILFRAGLYPFKRRSQLTPDDIERLYAALSAVLTESIETLRERVGENIHEEVRDFLLVHGKGGQPCPRCGTVISQVAANQRITNFCRTCQPGLLIRRT